MKLGQYIVARFVSYIMQFLGGMALMFVVINNLPYDPTGVIVWFAQPATPEAAADLVKKTHAQWGIDKPIYIQYFVFLQRLFGQGSFGNTWVFPIPINSIFATTLPITFGITFSILVMVIPLSLLLGSQSANKSKSNIDNSLKIITSLIYGIPYFILAVLYLLIVDINQWEFTRKVTFWINATLTVFILVIIFSSYQYRLVRKEFIEVLEEAYILTARSKGLSERSVIYKHGLRNILTSLIQSYSWLLPLIISSELVIEYLLNIPGLGAQVVGSGIILDWGLVIAFSALFLLVNGFIFFLTDVAVKVISPNDDLHEIWHD